MLDFDEHSGILTFLGGIIIVVLVAVGFSLVLDKRFKFSSGVEEMRREVELQDADLKELAVRHEQQSMLLARSETGRKSAAEENSGLDRELASLRQRQELLRGKKSGLESEIASLETRFSDYRAAYRAHTWSRAVGEKLGDLKLQGGREYLGSQITKVTDVGLEIRHEHGIARIQAPDLSPAMQDRFQWNDEERRRRLKEEEAHLRGKSGTAVAEEEEESAEPSPGEEDEADRKAAELRQREREERNARKKVERERVLGLRQKVKSWRTKVAQLSAEQNEAQSNSYGNSNSVPGSLETWKEKSVRLGKELAKARAELEKAKGKLSSASPADAELAQEPHR